MFRYNIAPAGRAGSINTLEWIMDMRKLALACVFATASFGALAGQPSYTYVEGGYLRMDPDDISLDPTGYYLDGSIAIADNLFLSGGYSDVDDSKAGLKVEIE